MPATLTPTQRHLVALLARVTGVTGQTAPEAAPDWMTDPCPRRHPGPDEDGEHRHRSAQLRTWTKTLLRTALNPAAG